MQQCCAVGPGFFFGAKSSMANKRKIVDWESVEADYRAGVRTLREISGDHDISHVAIKQRADKEGWARDLSAKIKAETESKLNKSLNANLTPGASEREIVSVNAERQACIILSHRKDISRKREIVNKLFDEVSAQTEHVDLLKQLQDVLISNDGRKTADLVRRFTSLPTRIKGACDLITAFKSLIELERKVFGIDGREEETGNGMADLLRKIHQMHKTPSGTWEMTAPDGRDSTIGIPAIR
jgi:hypothetical protein